MMSKHPLNGRDQYIMISLEELLPKDHLIRKIDKAIDFSFIYPIVESTYSTLGQPSIDPVVYSKSSSFNISLVSVPCVKR
jgi:hypothetical protein